MTGKYYLSNRSTVPRTGEMGINWCRFRSQKGNTWMKRIAVLTLLMALGAGCSMSTRAQNTSVSKSDRQSDQLARKKQNALYKYQKKQEKAQEKAERRAEKQQQKAAKKYEKEQRKQLKNANLPVKHTS
jgi:uncharacterized protein HemX